MIVMIIETIVKEDKVAKIIDKFKLKGMFMDNYHNHDNV